MLVPFYLFQSFISLYLQHLLNCLFQVKQGISDEKKLTKALNDQRDAEMKQLISLIKAEYKNAKQQLKKVSISSVSFAFIRNSFSIMFYMSWYWHMFKQCASVLIVSRISYSAVAILDSKLPRTESASEQRCI